MRLCYFPQLEHSVVQMWKHSFMIIAIDIQIARSIISTCLSLVQKHAPGALRVHDNNDGFEQLYCQLNG